MCSLVYMQSYIKDVELSMNDKNNGDLKRVLITIFQSEVMIFDKGDSDTSYGYIGLLR